MSALNLTQNKIRLALMLIKSYVRSTHNSTHNYGISTLKSIQYSVRSKLRKEKMCKIDDECVAFMYIYAKINAE